MIKLSEGGIAEMWKDEKSPEMQAISYALQKAVAMVIEKAEKTKCFSDIDKLDEKTLDYFAVEQRAMYYSQTLPIEQKKAIIKNTLNWYTKAGTPAAVSEMVDVVLGGGKVVEWFDFRRTSIHTGNIRHRNISIDDIRHHGRTDRTRAEGQERAISCAKSHRREKYFIRHECLHMDVLNTGLNRPERIARRLRCPERSVCGRIY